MFGRLDFTAYDQRGRPSVAIEAKRTPNKTNSWATSWRRNYMENAPAGFGECMHVLVTPDRIFIWSQGESPGEQPSFELNAEPLLKEYFARVGIAPDAIGARAFERLVAWWLRDLAEGTAAGGPLNQEIQQTGLLPRLAGARIVEEDAA